jgi:hypothetical protein
MSTGKQFSFLDYFNNYIFRIKYNKAQFYGKLDSAQEYNYFWFWLFFRLSKYSLF